MVHIREILPDAIKDLITKIYEGKATTEQKIQSLIIARRANHGNDDIQDLCNTYLTKLYDEKYNKLGGII